MSIIERISGKITDEKGRATVDVIGTMDIMPELVEKRGDGPMGDGQPGDRKLGGGQLGSWRGELKLPIDMSVKPGAYTLTLDNGRQGNIVITSVRANVGTRNAAAFLGSGPPPV